MPDAPALAARLTRRSAGLLAGVATLVLGVAASAVAAGFNAASVTNGQDSAAVGYVAITHTYASGACSSGARQSSLSCAGTIASSSASSSTPATVTDSVRNDSGLNGGAFTEQVRVASCAPAEFKNSIGSDADPMLPRYSTGFRATDPWATQGSASFDGTTSYAADVATTNLATLLGSQFSIGVWFKASATSAGGLIGLSSSPTATAGLGASPVLYMDTSGKIRFRYSGGLLLGTVTGSSPNSYRDGVWHLAVLSVTGTLASTTNLYVDGAAVSTAVGSGLLSLSGSGYWHTGWADLTGLVGAPSSFYFAGGLAGAYVDTGQSQATVQALAGSRSAAAYASALSGADDLWMLDDSGTSTFTGAVGYISGGDACTMDMLQWSLGGTMTPASAATLRALVTSGWLPATPASAPGVGMSQTISTTYQRVTSGYDTDASGLRLVAPLNYRIQLVNAPNWGTTFQWDSSGAALIA